MKTRRAEQQFAKQLREIGRHAGRIIAGFPPGDLSAIPTIQQMLAGYAQLLQPWAERATARMLADVNSRDLQSWSSLGTSISLQLHRDIREVPVGQTIRDLLAEQVGLIRSIPLDAADRVHRLTIEALEDSTRAREIKAEIMRSGEVAESRALLIARTEVARTASALTQARAQSIGSDAYVWETSHDGAVRPSHRAMQGKVVRWDDPPTLDDMTGHAGQFPNCRCWPRPIIPLIN